MPRLSGIQAARKALRGERLTAAERAPALTKEQKALIKRMDAQIARDKRTRRLKRRIGGQLYGRGLTKAVEESRKKKKSMAKPRRH